MTQIDADAMNQDLEMMIQKRSRCEDWVASVALRKENREIVEGTPLRTRENLY